MVGTKGAPHGQLMWKLGEEGKRERNRGFGSQTWRILVAWSGRPKTFSRFALSRISFFF